MVSAAVLAAALIVGQVNAQDGPAREWHSAIVAGKVVQLWGWKKPTGYIGFVPQENAHVFTQYRQPAPAPQPRPPLVQPGASPYLPGHLNPGQTISPDGALNNGLLLRSFAAERPTGNLETNDPDLARKLEANDPCPGPGPCPPDDPDVPDDPDKKPKPRGGNPDWDQLEPFAVPCACLIAGVALFACAKRNP